MKFNVNKFALAAATSATLFFFIRRVVFKMFLFQGMLGTKGMMCGYGWRMMDAASRAKSLRPSVCHWGWCPLKIVIVFVSAFAAAWFFAWFYNKLVSKK